MHRELNPQLFGTRSQADLTPEPGSPLNPANAPKPAPAGAQSYLPMEVKALEAQVHSLKMLLNTVERKQESMGLQIQEFAKSTATRFDRFSQALMRLEEAQAQGIQEITSKYSGLAGKISERKVSDSKVQEMIDRHNHIVRNFENRLTSLQRLMSEQEMQIMASNAALDEARQEIARLKKGT